ncbi:helix-turn-helix domain-containing protein [Actinotalea sp. Marseille-Q4924]|uniref:helix-turn-helix domain-containing protein n=1 Tax=Actinotalea sp. Marseille-Q4924 TaxID=2866571 RepID=UPI001CE495BF|nr:helix-turn-helix domain-containing protein [Actinotalea sp. Marseille-Q4924]
MPIPRSEPALRLPPGARRAALLAALERAVEPTTAAELAQAAGLHPNTVRAHLEVLVREGRATRRTERRGTRGRPRELYEATGAPDPAQAYAALALLLAEQLATATSDPGAEGERMGRRWATRGDDAQEATRDGRPPGPEVVDRDGVAEVMTVLRRAGFAPELTTDGTQVLLHSCPVRDVAHAQPTVVCQAHLGLIRATLEAAGSDVVATRIEPFVAPDLCVASFDRPADAAPGPVPAAASALGDPGDVAQ